MLKLYSRNDNIKYNRCNTEQIYSQTYSLHEHAVIIKSEQQFEKQTPTRWQSVGTLFQGQIEHEQCNIRYV